LFTGAPGPTTYKVGDRPGISCCPVQADYSSRVCSHVVRTSRPVL